MVRIRRGDVFWAETPGGRRPALVLTRDAAIPLLRRLVVVPATSTIRTAPSEVRLGKQDGMPRDCVLALDDLRMIPKSGLKSRITSLSASKLEEVCDRLAYALGC